MKKNVHVVPSEEGWSVKSGGSTRSFQRQSEAEEFGREVARETEVEFFLHGEDGKIRLRDSYGNDPRDIPG